MVEDNPILKHIVPKNSIAPNRLSAWLGLVLSCALMFMLVAVMVMPSLGVLFSWLNPQLDIWRHLAETQLARITFNTLFLLLGVLALSGVLGVSMAWLNTVVRYPGRSWLQYALVLPLAQPIYVLAFAFLGVFGIGGSVQTKLQILWPSYAQVDVRSPWVLIIVMSLSLFPYVYLLVRNALLARGVQLIEVARTLGLNRYQSFVRVILPAIRPALVASLILVTMETLAELGAVSIFNYDTFTTAIYKTWFGFFNFMAALQLASLLLLIALLLPAFEGLLRGKARFNESSNRPAQPARPLHGFAALGAFVACFLVFTCAFALPITQLLIWAWQVYGESGWIYGNLLIHTFALASMVTVVGVPLSLMAVLWSRWRATRLARLVPRLLSTGYSLPGTVLAAGTVSVASILVTWLGLAESTWVRIFLPGSLVLLVLACLSRFMALSIGTLESALNHVRRSMVEVALLLGLTRIRVVWRIYLPLLAPAVATAGLLLFVETIREMPITLLLRPFGWDTLAVHIFELSSEGEWSRAAMPAIILVLIGLVPVLLAVRRQYPVRDRSQNTFQADI